MKKVFFCRFVVGIFVCFMLAGCAQSTPSATSTTPKNFNISLGDNSRVSVDWSGVYEGITPCADCEGIKTRLVLAKEGFYKLSLHYLGKSSAPFTEQGPFTWDETGGKIALEGIQGGIIWYRIGENKIMLLDQEGNLVVSSSGAYELNKVSSEAHVEEKEAQLQEVYWKLIGIRGKAVVLKENQREPYIMFKIENNRLQGFGGCNLLMGAYEVLEGQRIRFSKVASTMMACPYMQEEQAFFKVLEQADNYTIKEGVLMLHKARMAPLATFEAIYLQ